MYYHSHKYSSNATLDSSALNNGSIEYSVLRRNPDKAVCGFIYNI